MAKGVILSEEAYAQLKQIFSWFKAHKGRLQPAQTRKGRGGSGGGAARFAFCKTDAPHSDEIICFLDTDETGTEVTVECNIANGDFLDKAMPRLTVGLRVTVVKIGDVWVIPGAPFNGGKLKA